MFHRSLTRIWPLTALFVVLLPALCAAGIHEAVVLGHTELTVSMLDERPEWLNARNKEDYTPLNLAAERGLTEITELLLVRDADPNLADIDNHSPLHHAAAGGHLEIVRRLLDCGATTINDTSRTQHQGFTGGWTPLHLATQNGHAEIVQLLLEHGANIEARDGVQRTPLILAAEGRDIRVAEVLVEAGADINAEAIQGYTALLWGVRNQFEPYVNLLLDHRVFIAPDAQPRLIQTAAVAGMERLYEYVIELGYDVNELRQHDPGLIFPAAAGGSVTIVQSLIDHGFDPARQDEDGWTPLHYAAAEGHTGVTAHLADLQHDINIRNRRGESAYNLAAMKGHDETAAWLQARGADTGPPQFPGLAGPYMGQPPPGDTPQLFLPGIVSAHDRAHSSLTFSPDGLEAYWTEMIPPGGRVACMHGRDGAWTYPVAAPIDRDPTFSPDGNRLFFIKTRPLREGETPGGDRDLKEEYCYLERTDTGWSAPISVGEGINSLPVHWPCSIDRDGNLYFSEFADKMYYAPYIDGRYEAPVPLAEHFGNPTLIGHGPFIAPGGDYLLFSAHDSLHISFRKSDGTWTDRRNLGGVINTSHVNGSPRVTADGKYMFFLSAGRGRPWGIYWVSTGFIERLRPE